MSSSLSPSASPLSDNTHTNSPVQHSSLNYGEMLHVEALVKQIERDEQLRKEAERREKQEVESCTFSPSISNTARGLSSREPLSRRFKEELEEKKQRLQQLQSSLLSESEREATFTPKTNAYKFAKERSDFLSEQQSLSSERDLKLSRLRSSLVDPSSFSPSISMYSQSLQREGPVHERLYSMAKKEDEDDVSDDEKSPEVLTPRSSSKRALSLYEEALRRRELMEKKMKEAETVPVQKGSKISDSSRKLAIKRVIRLLRGAFEEISSENLTISRSEMSTVLRNAGFFKQSPSPNDRSQEKSFIDRLFTCIELPMRDTFPLSSLIRLAGTALKWNKDDLYEELREIDDVINQKTTGNDDVYLTPIEGFETMFVSVLKDFQQFNSLRLAFIKNERKHEDDLSDSFKPTINRKSAYLDKSNQSTRNQARHERLIMETKRRQQKVEQLKRDRELKELDQCTFKPNISRARTNVVRSRSNDQLYTRKKPTVSKHMIPREEKDLAECTFKPNLAKSPVKNQPQLPARTKAAMEATVQRMRKAKEQREEDRKRAEGSGYSDSTWARRKRDVEPFDFATEKRSTQRESHQPLLYMDVGLGGGKMGRLGIHEGDDPDELAQRFGEVYHLDEVLVQRLSLLIKDQLINLNLENS
ncbi:hypothetical protein P9112_014591 [Eukaryota sp. TZLM1-RC]